MEYKIKIDAFEGPLDLLLHLIKQLEIDIYDIPVAEITEQYLDFIHRMQVLELDVASEFLVMAATLIEMKSKMLLPKPEPLEDDLEGSVMEFEDDPREELMRRLLEYRQYKQAAQVLKEREQQQNRLYAKLPSDLSHLKKGNQPQTANATIYDMVTALQRVFKRKKINQPLNTKVQRQSLPIGQRMREVIDVLKERNEPVSFDSLFPYPNRSHIVVTFMALLELMKKKQIICTQDHNFQDISICLAEGAKTVAVD
ncbi:segregation and condensation protein A [Scopulibacillus daqui]|uniref:Segregation and condensation protein A n=1 Tax=Scopulibacillus daqui TaxID=1469162 RepID=A0ABS2Q0I4_9BACL|nr:segregation/condensation protein A [Scopulibacillus daqui]MBM7645345.1 segregation and condensation protein A [Scopulibacillus daqui]